MNETRFSPVTVNDLRLFLTVCDTGSFTLAGVNFGLSQPGVSRTMRQLEQRVGHRLFIRTGRGVTPTKAGDLLRVFSQAQIVNLEGLESALDRLSNARPSEVRMVLPMRIGRLLIPPLVRAAAVRWPEVALRIQEELPSTIPMSVQNGSFDFGIAYEPGIGSAETSERLACEALWLVGSNNLFKGCSDPIPLSEVARFPLLLSGPQSPYRQLIEKAFRSAGLLPKVKREIETADALFAFAAEGEGVAILPFSTIYQEIAQGMAIARRIIQPEIKRSVWLLVSPAHKDAFVGDVVRLVRDVIRENKTAARWS